MRISVIGCGYLGAVHAACMADLRHDVVGVDVHFVCVGTTQRAGEDAADTSYVDAAVQALAPSLRARTLVVGKSTVPVGTAARLAQDLRSLAPAGHEVVLAWNPEFLREGHAVGDTLRPDRLVYGVPDGPDGRAGSVLDHVYRAALDDGTPLVVTDYPPAELLEFFANALLATRISFINAMAEVCEATGADVTQLADAIGHDDRIGRKFFGAGLGFGGGCPPKDIRAFMARAGELGADQALTPLREVDAVNLRRSGADGRAHPGRALRLAGRRPRCGARRRVRAAEGRRPGLARRVRPRLSFVDDAMTACRGTDAVLLLTEWQPYRDLDPEVLGGVVRLRGMLDGRNALDPGQWRAAGWTYRSLGRHRVAAAADHQDTGAR